MNDDTAGTEVVRREDFEKPPQEAQDRSQLPSGMLEPVVDPSEIVASRTKRSEMIAEALVEGRDYGSVSGIPKPFLQKPGAERLTDAFGCYPRFRIIDQEVDHDRRIEWEKRSNGKSGTSRGLYRYVVSCDLIHRASGIVVGNGLGVCSSMEDKYVESPRNAENTIAKMAKKRAHVDAALSTFGLSEMFTQDSDYVRENGDASGPWSPDDKVGFGKHGDETWAEVVESDPDYAEWLMGADRTPDEASEWLEARLSDDDEEAEGDPRMVWYDRLTDALADYQADPTLFVDMIVAYCALREDQPDPTEGEKPLQNMTAADFERAVKDLKTRGKAALEEIYEAMEPQGEPA